MNTALVIAGGSGQRTGQEIPKQFLNVNNKPIVIYTLEAFQKNANVDTIEVVCIDGWQAMLQAYAKQFGISKLKNILSGGASRFYSIYEGIKSLKKTMNADDMLIIHDANRPMVTDEIIDDNLRLAKMHGAAVAAMQCDDSMYCSVEKQNLGHNTDRTKVYYGQGPESIRFGKAYEIYKQYAQSGGTNLPVTGMLIEQGEPVKISMGRRTNFKITTSEDILMFQAMLYTKENLWLKGFNQNRTQSKP